MKILKVTFTLFYLFLFVACDKQVGEKGVVQDLETGERLENVVVKMTSSQGDRTDTTDFNGHFSVLKFFSCGIGNCDTDYQIKFIKEDYDTLIINENFYNSSLAEFVNENKKDTLIIKLKKHP